MDFLSGKKTYLTGAVMVLIAAATMFGVVIPGFEGVNAGQLLTEGLGLIFLRSGVANA